MFNRENIVKSLLSVLACILFMQPVFATNIDRIIAFGDSLSDNGNIYSMTKKAGKIIPMVPTIPKNPPYYNGRFSNGPVWLEDLSVAMDVPLSDYAYGGSWAEPLQDSGLIFPFSLATQVDMYMVGSVLDYHQGDHLFVIWIGANDYIAQRGDQDYATDNTIANIKSQIDWLISYGAKHFFVPGVADISVTPEVKKQGPQAVRDAEHIVDLHNKKLMKMLRQEKLDNPDVDFLTVDITAYMDDMISHPEKYNIKNMTDSCYDGGYWLQGLKADDPEIQAAKKANLDLLKSPGLRTAYMTAKLASKGQPSCTKPDDYFFWDQLHPTRRVHMIIAAETLRILHENGIFGSDADQLAKK